LALLWLLSRSDGRPSLRSLRSEAQFARPHSLFGTFGGSNRGSGDHSWGGLAAGQEPAPFETEVPEGLVNVCPNAGDFVIMPESTTHGVLPWRGKGQRHALVLRFRPYTGGEPRELPPELESRLPAEVNLLRRGKL